MCSLQIGTGMGFELCSHLPRLPCALPERLSAQGVLLARRFQSVVQVVVIGPNGQLTVGGMD
jgi:hypothetical protein